MAQCPNDECKFKKPLEIVPETASERRNSRGDRGLNGGGCRKPARSPITGSIHH